MKDALGYYQILNVSVDADIETIKQSYRDLAKIWHPDNNHDKDTTDMFQKLSVAYETLSDTERRRIYDILSLVYNDNNYPDMENITPYKDGTDGIDIAAVNLQEIKAWGIRYKQSSEIKVVNYTNALKINAKVAAINWLAGWWHPKTFVRNIKAIYKNFKNPISSNDSLKIMLHNMIAYHKENQNVLSAKCAVRIRDIVSAEDRKNIDDFVASLNVKVARSKVWNLTNLRAVQLIVPIILTVTILLPGTGKYFNLSESELWSIFSKNKEINYYQTVDFGGRGKSVDDVVVGKVVSIPVDKSDNSQLYHLVQESKIMYGPSDEFDVIKILPNGTTVRLTGYTPDNIWARVLIDNGETGFLHFSLIEQGIGKEIPFGSSITD